MHKCLSPSVLLIAGVVAKSALVCRNSAVDPFLTLSIMGNATSETTVPSIAVPSAPLAEAQPEGTLLPLTSWEYKQYNQLAIKMDYYVRSLAF
jgi:hypothetical protein